MMMFHSYVSLPEGIHGKFHFMSMNAMTYIASMAVSMDVHGWSIHGCWWSISNQERGQQWDEHRDVMEYVYVYL